MKQSAMEEGASRRQRGEVGSSEHEDIGRRGGVDVPSCEAQPSSSLHLRSLFPPPSQVFQPHHCLSPNRLRETHVIFSGSFCDALLKNNTNQALTFAHFHKSCTIAQLTAQLLLDFRTDNVFKIAYIDNFLFSAGPILKRSRKQVGESRQTSGKTSSSPHGNGVGRTKDDPKEGVCRCVSSSHCLAFCES
jgi:hypothetical protein